MRLSNIDSIEDAFEDPLPYILHLVKLLVIIDMVNNMEKR